MDYGKLLEGMKRFGSIEWDICEHGLRVAPDCIQDNVVIAPWWEPSALPGLGEVDRLSPPDHTAGVWNIKNDTSEITYIKTGIGAPLFLERLLPLGVTKCKRVIFIGSAGSLDPGIRIGDIVIPEYSVCGDGASRYLASDDLTHDVFGEKAYPDYGMFNTAVAETTRICIENHVNWHIGKTFSIDTVTAQFAHIDTIVSLGCNVIEMETAAAFRAAKLMGIPLIALFSVSDNTVMNKSLVSGRTAEEMEYRRFTRREIFPKIIQSVFSRC